MPDAAVNVTNAEEPAAERFDPARMQGRMIESEHLARYRWATEFAAGRRVLDAGCGHGYGAALLAQAGATEVVGVDISQEVIDAAQESTRANVTLEVGDVTRLSHPDASFGLIVCFEVIEHLAEPDRALDEFARLLADDGILVVSSPNRDVYTKGNPHHIHEYLPDELNDALAARFPTVTLRRQHTWIASGILDDESFATGDDSPLPELTVRKLEVNEPGREIYTLAVAGRGPLPSDHGVIELNAPVELRQWDALWHEQRVAIEQQIELIGQQKRLLDTQQLELGQLRHALVEAEREISVVHEQQAELAELHQLLEQLEGVGADRDLYKRRYEDIAYSKSWRMTKFLRDIADSLRPSR
jgi:SAM-dependent methyltransferase